MKLTVTLLYLLPTIAAMSAAAVGQTPTFREPAASVEVYDFAEVAISVQGLQAANPFADVTVTGEFRRETGEPVRVDGFCDAADGSLFRIRFMPTVPGRYDYLITFRQGGEEAIHEGSFTAIPSRRKGILRVDAEFPEHFVWEGTGEHYFWNGTTTYYLMGWDDETIRRSIDRLAGYKVNRLRVLLYGRNKPHPWNQPVVPTDRFKLHLNPWPAERPDDVANPGFDLTRFNVEHWQKYERLLRYARERDVVVSVIFYIGGQVLPTPFAAGSVEEDLYYRYGVARLAAFSNVTWDLGNEYNFHWPAPAWADEMGPKVKQWDPYDHLCSAHNVTHRTPQSTWCDMQLIQRWDSGQNAFMLGQREEQKKTGRIIPQINEEYGYEDLWEKTPGQRRADTRRRCAWEVVIAGCYQTTGESARTGTGVAPISADPEAKPENWRFFAVTYDATAATEQVKFYLGDARRVAERDRAATYAQGCLGPRTGPLTIGAFNPTTRAGKGDRLFRGLIDDIRLFGSTNDGAGALDLEQIRSIQQGKETER